MPSAAERDGNLNDLVAVPGSRSCANPFTGAPFPNNTIPTGSCQACINPVAQALLNYYPLPKRQPGRRNPVLQLSDSGAQPRRTPTASMSASITISIPNSRSMCASASRTRSTREFNQARASLPPHNNFLPNEGAHDQNRSLVASYNYSITPQAC